MARSKAWAYAGLNVSSTATVASWSSMSGSSAWPKQNKFQYTTPGWRLKA